MFEEWFWLRLNNDTSESSLDSVPLFSSNVSGNQIRLLYANSLVSVGITYTLVGGSPLQPVSHLTEDIAIGNPSAGSVSIAFFSETDLDMAGSGANDSIVGDAAGVNQFADIYLAHVTGTPQPDAFQISPFPDIFVSLTDTSVTNLNNSGSPFGPGDGSFAYQWNLLLAGHSSQSLQIEKDIEITPEPSNLPLVAAGTGGLLALSRKWLRR
jgi:hypothetical protein